MTNKTIRDLLIFLGKQCLIFASTFAAEDSSVEVHAVSNLTTGDWTFAVQASGIERNQRVLARGRAKLLALVERHPEMVPVHEVDNGKDDIYTSIHMRDGESAYPDGYEETPEIQDKEISLLRQRRDEWNATHPHEVMEDEDSDGGLTTMMQAVL